MGELLSPPRERCGRVGAGGDCEPRRGRGAPRLPGGSRMAPPAAAGARSPAPGTGSGLGPATSLPPSLPPSPAAAAAARGAGAGRRLVLRRAASGPGRRRTPAVNAGGRGGSSRPAGLPPLQCRRRQTHGPRAVGSRGTKPAGLPRATGAPRGTLPQVASPRPGARGGYGRRRAPRPGDPAGQRAWRRRRKRQHREALRPGPRVPGGGGGGPGAPPSGGRCGAATRQRRASAAFPPRAPAEGRARCQDFARKSPFPPSLA